MECGNCTMCCILPEIKETNSKFNEYCSHCNPNVGCNIYDERPKSCKIFECCWKQMKNAGEELRPDKCGVLFEKWSDKIIVGATNEELSNLILSQIDYFRNEGISILIVDHTKKTRTYFLAEGHTKDFVWKEINGSTKLYN